MNKVGPFLFLTYFIFKLSFTYSNYFIGTIFVEQTKNYIKRIGTIYIGCIGIELLTGS
jgi:hypothetical protein